MTKERKDSKAANVTGAFIAGVAMAAVAGGYYLFGSKNANKNRQKIESWTLKAKAEVLEKLEKGKQLGQDEYERIVDGVADKYAKAKDVGSKKAEDLRIELKRHWEDIKKDAEKLDKKVAKKVNKESKKAKPKKS